MEMNYIQWLKENQKTVKHAEKRISRITRLWQRLRKKNIKFVKKLGEPYATKRNSYSG